MLPLIWVLPVERVDGKGRALDEWWLNGFLAQAPLA